jgi:hypothetical protein
VSDLNERAGKALAGRWRAGMADTFGTRVLALLEDGHLLTSELVDEGWSYTRDVAHARVKREDMHDPDMADACTRGGFLDVAREAWGDSTLHVVCAGGSRELGVWHARWGTSSRRGATEAEALVAALESAA